MRYAPASGLPNSSSLALWHGRRNLRRSPLPAAPSAQPLRVHRQISVDSSGPLRTISVLSLVNTLNDAKPEDDLARRDDLLVELPELARAPPVMPPFWTSDSSGSNPDRSASLTSY